MINNVGLIGVGRFGKVLANILKKGFHVKAYDIVPSKISGDLEKCELEEILKLDHIFIAVPIRYFEPLIKEVSKKINHPSTIIDVCSVKKHTSEIMLKHLPKDIGIISSHPMFGPDSFNSNVKLKMMINKTRVEQNIFKYWKQFFTNQNIKVIEMTPDEHDKMAASSQGITHFIGRVLDEAGIRSTQINTYGFNELLGVIEQTCNDSWDLFKDLQEFNPYTNVMIDKMIEVINKLHLEIKENADQG